MGLAEEHVKAIRGFNRVVEAIFNRLSINCRFYNEDKLEVKGSALTIGKCFYYGRSGARPCVREICPLLEKD